MKDQLAYLDEFGTNALNVTDIGVSTHFIVTAVIINESDKRKVEAELERVRKKHFRSGEMKSRNVANNHKRRQLILRDLLNIDFKIYSLVVDKTMITSEGLSYKPSFYKFINGLLYADLYKLFPNLQLHADETGRVEYMHEFAKYVNRKHIPSLFTQSSFQFVRSDSCLLVQLADFVSGTLSRCFDDKVLSETHKSQFLEALAAKVLLLKFWPKSFHPFKTEQIAEDGKYDPVISELGMNLAEVTRETLSKSKEDEDEDRDQRVCLDHLLFHFRYINPNKYVWQKELIGNIEAHNHKTITKRYFMSRVVAQLRNKGVIISSSSKGYKLPANEDDLHAFLKHGSSIIKPMIDRIQICRDNVKAATLNKLDILSNAEFSYIKKALDQRD